MTTNVVMVMVMASSWCHEGGGEWALGAHGVGGTSV
jgi:hypothetical protein